jgi:hypothetical protein
MARIYGSTGLSRIVVILYVLRRRSVCGKRNQNSIIVPYRTLKRYYLLLHVQVAITWPRRHELVLQPMIASGADLGHIVLLYASVGGMCVRHARPRGWLE